MTPIHLGLFLASFAGGGAERAMLTLAGAIVARGHRVDVVVARNEGPYRTAVPESVRLVDLEVRRVMHALPRLAGYLRREHPDALLSTLDYANVIAIVARWVAGVPTRVLVNEQNTISITSRQSPQRRQRLMPRLVRRCYPWADWVIGNSEGVASDLSAITHLPPSRIQLVYNPVVTPGVLDRARERPPHPWFEPAEPPVILGAGRLMPQKDFPTLIRAFARVRAARRARLVILGEGPGRDALADLAARLGVAEDVQLLGFVDNPYAYMAHAAVFVLSSRWEGLPTVLIEALACGVPVVSTECPSGPREILAAGRHGVLVPMQNVPVLSDAIVAALDGRVPRPGEDSWRPFALDAVVDRYVELLTKAQAAV